MNWTKEQQNAIDQKGHNILVAAAAGSGKTAVLVERIIQKILKQGVDIDKLLVVTFTNAAASEMRERVLEAIYKKLDEDPEDENLQKQIVLLGKSNICTIHSFCLDVIKNHFFEIDLSANFRIGAEEEITLLKQEVLDDVFEELYENEDKEFMKLIQTYTSYRGDEPLKEIIFNIYTFMQSAPFPTQWLEEKIQMFQREEKAKDFSESIWGHILLKNVHEELTDAINSLKMMKEKMQNFPELDKYNAIFQSDIEVFRLLQEKTKISWQEAYTFCEEMEFDNWVKDTKITLDLKNEAKKLRDHVKTKTVKNVKSILLYPSEEAYENIYGMYDTLCALKNVILKFDQAFQTKKKERNIVDFNDIEHYALQILVKKNEKGEYVATDVAKAYQKKFEEIAIDEYQDSNYVQEYILSTISRGNNIFMVGDVKQSIYKFRQACPDLFLEKYKSYSLEENPIAEGIKIQLFKNFRSKANVLDVTNTIFEKMMSTQLGDNVDYTEEEYLHLGAEYEPIDNDLGIAELHIIDRNDVDEETEETDDASLKQLEKEEIEARFVAQKIEELIASKAQVKDKVLGYRDVTYKDIVILLRAPSKLASIYEKVCLSRNIPVFSDCSNEYLDTIEIQTMLNVLKILDNPIDDIALVSVLRSQIGGFNDNEILEIRLCNTQDSFYQSLLDASKNLKGELQEKIVVFLNTINFWRKQTDYLSIAELLWEIYTKTGFYQYVGLMPNGNLRQANLKMLFERAKEYEKTSFKGLFQFIRFIEKLKLANNDLSSAKMIGENENVVRIMSIHKSKGLEFPVVILPNTAKKFNLRDLSDQILLHSQLGIGPKYIDYDRKIEYSTAAREAIKILAKEEALAEEMRVLYVALTRAKEKLIITGLVNNYAKVIEKKKELLNIYHIKDGKINPIILKKMLSYLDWIELVYLSENMKNQMQVYQHPVTEITKQDLMHQENVQEFDFHQPVDRKSIEEKLTWQYEHALRTKLPIKTTVSKIKKMHFENTDQGTINLDNLEEHEIGFVNIVPSFLEQTNSISASRKGTIMHAFLQKINFKETYTMQMLEDLKEEMILKKWISKEEADTIRMTAIEKFLNSSLATRIRKAQEVQKEKAFCMQIPAKEVIPDAKTEAILVQGIIDLYFVEDDHIILVDYKTDIAKEEKELVEKYAKQLDLYKRALKEATGKPVVETYIYSLYFDKEIPVCSEKTLQKNSSDV